MMTPFEIEDRVAKIKLMAGSIGASGLTRQLHVEVLREIAKGTIDPRSLAIAALETEDG